MDEKIAKSNFAIAKTTNCLIVSFPSDCRETRAIPLAFHDDLREEGTLIPD